jgi:hypothetical protein
LQGYNATHTRALVTDSTSVAKIATELTQLLYALVDILYGFKILLLKILFIGLFDLPGRWYHISQQNNIVI